MERRQRERVTLAWMVGSYVGFSKLPPLDEVLAKLKAPAPAEQLPDEEIMHRMDLWRLTIARGHPPTT